MKCPKCQSDNPSSSKFCAECATPLPSSKEFPILQTETLQTSLRELTTGSTFAGRYQVIEELGHGGMGRVYKVFDTKIKEKVALKLIKPEVASDKDTIERFSQRDPAGPQDRPPERLQDVRHRGGRGRPLHHHGVCPRRGPQEHDPHVREPEPGHAVERREADLRTGWPKPIVLASSTGTSNLRTS